MSRIALIAALFAATLLAACNSVTSRGAKTEFDNDRRFIYGIPQNDR